MQNTGLRIKPRASDFVMGDGNVIFKAVSSGDWTSHYQFFEQQKFTYDTNGCVLFAASENFDAQMDLLLATAPISIVNQIVGLGYMDVGRDNAPHFHSSPRFLQILTGNGYDGNSIPEAWDVIRKYGVLPFKDLPFDATITQTQYIDSSSITPAMYAKAAQFLALIGGKQSVQYHWVIDNAPKNISLMQAAQLHAPLCVGIAVNDVGYNQTIPTDPPASEAPGHAMATTQITAPTVECIDHYDPFIKTLDTNYPIHFVLQGVVSINPPATPPPVIPIPLPTDIAPTQQNVDVLTEIKNVYTEILALLQGRNLSGINTMTKTLSLVSSDYIKALVMAVIAPVLGYIFSVVQSGSFAVDWHQVGLLAATAGIGYIIKQLGTSTTVVATAPVPPVAVSETVMGITLPVTAAVSPAVLPSQTIPPPATK